MNPFLGYHRTKRAVIAYMKWNAKVEIREAPGGRDP